MELKSYLLARLEAEAALTRKTIERVPEGLNDYRPHPRSMPLGYLAALVASMPGWITLMIERDELDFGDPRSQSLRAQPAATREALIAASEQALESGRRSLSATTDEHLLTPWAFKMNGQTLDGGPRHVMISEAVLSHLAHHRGQLTVYLRLNEAPVPALYGPSADEQH